MRDVFDIVDRLRAGQPHQDNDDWERYLEAQFFTKSVDWSYEQEWRIALTNSAGRKLPFDPGELKAVFLGAKSSEVVERKVRSMVGNAAPVHKMKLHDEDFRVFPI